MFNSKSQKDNERVIVDGQIVDVRSLRDEARAAGTRFWVLLVLVSLISSMVVPYLSMAGVVATNSQVFDSEMVIPGYSLGGIDITAYGVDINSWGQTDAQSESNPHIVQSTYGYWTKARAENASKNLVASKREDDKASEGDMPLADFAVDDTMLDSEEKAKGWIGITRDNGKGTGLSDFHTNPEGVAADSRMSYSESVAPYRTQEDWRFWDSRTVGGTETTMSATLYPDFVVFGWNEQTQTARVLGNPDSVENPTSSEDGDATSGVVRGTMAEPRYVPLSRLFEAYGLDKTVMGDNGMNDMSSLLSAIGKDASEHNGKATKLNDIVKNSTDSKNNLLVGTHYENLNGSNRSQEPSSDAWNPYPYSVVFHASTNSGTVVSSIYNNTEAYVYFSPRSVYNNYMAIRSEYDELVSEYANAVASEDPSVAFQLGYYLAGMSILEAYLNEALPQDMTRGYVGPAEGNPIADANKSLGNDKKLNTRSGDSGTVSELFKGGLETVDGGADALGFKSVAYSQLMYDFADAAIGKFKQKGAQSKLGMTSAILNTLSTYGYGTKDSGNNVNTSSKSAGQGPNRGMTRQQAMAKVTAFGPYSDSTESLDVPVDGDDDPLLNPDANSMANTGLYVPGYHPVQQHEMPISEMTYRFQVVSDIPYETVTHALATNGFQSRVSLSYENNAIENLAETKEYYNKSASLSRQLNDLDKEAPDLSLGGWDSSKSILMNPESQTQLVGDQATKAFSEDKDLTTRIDNAFLAFKQGRMNADNVHDMVDIVRAIPGVKYETFMRYYNPMKSSGGADDIFLTRVTPAQTPYMPKMLTAGYECAGGTTNNSNVVLTSKANFNYFSIPSLSPCLAAKTAEDTYYGALNYELRPFYTEGFLSNLPANANIPALEKYEVVKSQIDTAKSGSKKKSKSGSSGSSNWGERIVDAAKLLLGKPWNETNWVDPGMCMTEAEYKGKPEDITGVLCSGLVNWAYWHAIGVDMKGSSGWGGCASDAPEVKFNTIDGFTPGMTTVPSGAQPGDLIETATHVMIYEGESNGKQMMIESGGSSGDVHETEVRMPDRGNPIVNWCRYDGPIGDGDLANIGGGSGSASRSSSDDEDDEEDATYIEDIKDKVVTIYVLAKRLSFATAYGKMADAQNGGETSVSLGSLDAAGLQGNIVASKNLASIKAALEPTDRDKYVTATNDDGSEGLLAKKTDRKLDTAKTGDDQKANSKGAQAIVDAAKGALSSGSVYNFGGDPFAGGSTLSNTDCSGLVSFCYAQAGLTNTRYCSGDFPADSNFVEVPYESAQPGDVAWWASGHVGIYVGNGGTIEHTGPEGTPVQDCPNRQSTWPPDAYYHFKGLDGGSSSVAIGLASAVTSVESQLIEMTTQVETASQTGMATQVDSGDFVARTNADDMSQTTVWYDAGDGTATATALVRTSEGWTMQAESTGTAMPSVQTSGGTHASASGSAITNQQLNGVVPKLTSTSSVSNVPPSSLANGYNTNPNPARSTKNDDEKDTDGRDSTSPSSSTSANGDPSSASAAAVPEDPSPYADNGGEADQIYIRDHLAGKGFVKASADQWDTVKGKHGISDMVTVHIPSGMTFSTDGGFDYVMQKFGQKHILSDELLGKKTLWCKESNGYAFVTDVKTVLSALYLDAFNGLLIPAGTYYWDSAGNIATYGGQFDGDDSKEDELLDYNTTAMSYSEAGNEGLAKETIDDYCEEAFGDAAAVWKNMAALNDQLPQQMQNVLAWADAQTTTESERNYLVDDDDPNLVITIGNKKLNAPSIGIIRSLADLESAQFEIADNDGDWVALPIVGSEGEDGDNLQSRMSRGVAGTTATASGNLAAYTISATVGRIDSLVSSNSSTSSIPYSGICSGNLMAGTDRYAQLQAHSIDHEGISSRTTGDLRSRTKVGTDVSIASSTTDAGTQQAISKTANLVNEFSADTIPSSVDAVSSAFASVLPDNGSGKTLQSESPSANASVLGNTPKQQTMAMTSTFDSVTMNRRSAASQKAEPSTGMLVANGMTSPTASAATGLTNNRELAQSLVSGAFSDAYAAIQSIALIMVLMFLMIIAFQNFVGYTSGKESDYIIAQTKLKTILPRSLIAVAMIGLPPIGGGMGFQGGCFLLLQVVNAIMDATLGVFTQGANTTELLAQIGQCLVLDTSLPGGLMFSIDLFGILLQVLSGFLFMIGSAVVILFIFVTDVMLFAFWAIGPIMWAFYTWPYSGTNRAPSHGLMGKFLTNLTGKMGMKTFAGKSIGADAASGWLFGYITTLSTVAAWNIMFWVAGNIFEQLRPVSTGTLGTTGTNADGSVATVPIMGRSTLGEFLTGTRSLFDTPAGGLLLTILFLVLVYFMYLMMKHSLGGAAGIVYKGFGGTLGTIRNHLGHEISELALVDEETRKKHLSKGFVTKHLSEERRDKLAEMMTSRTAVNVGNAVRMADSAAHDMGKRIDDIAKYNVKPVQQRGDSSGAFDGILTLEDEYTYAVDENGEKMPVKTGRKKIHATAALTAAAEGALSVGTHIPLVSNQLLQKRIEGLDDKLATLEAADAHYQDFKRLKALQALDPECMEDGRLHQAEIAKKLAKSYAELVAAEKAQKSQLGQATKQTKKLTTKQVKQQRKQLEGQLKAIGASIDELKGLSEKDVLKSLDYHAGKTSKQMFRKLEFLKDAPVAQVTSGMNYAEYLEANQEQLREQHARDKKQIEVLKAARDSAVIQLGDRMETPAHLNRKEKKWELPEASPEPPAPTSGPPVPTGGPTGSGSGS